MPQQPAIDHTTRNTISTLVDTLFFIYYGVKFEAKSISFLRNLIPIILATRRCKSNMLLLRVGFLSITR
jgi:hypothetical protein